MAPRALRLQALVYYAATTMVDSYGSASCAVF